MPSTVTQTILKLMMVLKVRLILAINELCQLSSAISRKKREFLRNNCGERSKI